MSRSEAERQLILLSASTAERRMAMRGKVGPLVAQVNWSRLATRLRSRRLLPPLGPHILELADGCASDDFVEAVDHALVAGRRHGAFLHLIYLRVMALLADAGIRSTPLKGPLLGDAIYSDAGRRLSSDVDLLVAPEDLQAAVEVVRTLGYEGPTDYVAPCGLPPLHLVLIHPHGELPPVELHWRVHWYEQRFALERLLPPTLSEARLWRPAPAAELVSLLLFYARDGFIDLRLASDLSAWWDVFGDGCSPDTVDELVHAYPALARVIRVAAKVAEQTVCLPAPRIIGDVANPTMRDRIAIRLANPNPRSSQMQLYADMGLIDGLLAPPGGFGAFIHRQVLPPREVREMQARHRARRRPRSSLSRAAGILARYGLTMLRLVRRPETLR